MARSKKCFKCEVVKPLSAFYTHVMMADGHLNKCKTCARNDVAKHRSKNIERIRAYDRERGLLPERIRKTVEVTRAWRNEDLRRTRCHNAVARALRKGEINKMPCEKCGSQKSVAHHEDYDKPLDIMWVCQPCHKQLHKEK